MEYLNQAYQTSLVKGSKHKTVIVLLNRATECFDLSEVAASVIQDVGVETALLLKEIFDRIELPPYEEIPDTKTDGFNGLTSWTVPDTAIKIVKVSKGSRKGEFLFSTGTIARVRDFYDQTEHLPYKPGASVGAYGSDVDQVEAILLSVAGHNNLVALQPKPRLRFRSFGDSSLEFELLCWARRPDERGRLIHGLNHQIYKAFDAANIQIP